MARKGAITLITGPSGCGKSLFCLRSVTEARAQGATVGGVLSPGRYVAGTKIGIDVIDLSGNERRSLATLRGEEDAAHTHAALLTTRWSFDAPAMAWANGVLQRATPCHLLIVDELGPLEWLQNRGWVAGIEAVSARAYDAALVVVRPSLMPLAQARWPDAALLDLGLPASNPPKQI